MQKSGVSDVVATVIIVALVIVTVGIVWVGVIPLIRNNLGSADSCMNTDVSIESSQGYTCWDRSQNITMVQIRVGNTGTNISGFKFIVSSKGGSISYPKDSYAAPNSYNVFYLDSTKISSIDRIGVVAVVKNGKTTKECSTAFVENIKTCNAGNVQSELVLYDDSCVANCSCASSIPFGQNCSNKCGGSCAGTKQDGTSNFPFVITNCTGLQNMNQSLTANYILWNNIDCSGFSGFIPIGNDSSAFGGTLNGNSKTISNLKIYLPGSVGYHSGLFGVLSGNVSNLGLINVNITGGGSGNGHTGGLVGADFGGNIFQCYVTGKIYAPFWVGGLVGYLDSGIVNDSYSIANVSGPSGGSLIGAYACGLNSFRDNTTSMLTANCLQEGKTTSQMQTSSTFINAGWNTSVWNLTNGYYPSFK